MRGMEYVIARSSISRLRQYATLPTCSRAMSYRFVPDAGHSFDMSGFQGVWHMVLLDNSEVNQGVRAQRRLHRLRYS